jgi:hypothetical protein
MAEGEGKKIVIQKGKRDFVPFTHTHARLMKFFETREREWDGLAADKHFHFHIVGECAIERKM